MNGQVSTVCEAPFRLFSVAEFRQELRSWTWNNVGSTGVVDAWALRFEDAESLSRFTHALSRAFYEVQNSSEWEKIKVSVLPYQTPLSLFTPDMSGNRRSNKTTLLLQ